MKSLKKTLTSFIAPLTLATAIAFSAHSSAIADDKKAEFNSEENQTNKVRLVEKGAVVSYGTGDLDSQGWEDDYEVGSLMLRLGWDIKPVAKKTPLIKKLSLKGKLTGLVEPFGSYVSSPESNWEAGLNLLAKYNFRHEDRKIDNLLDRINPYIEGGFGVIYSSQDLEYQSTKANFLLQAGAGLDYEIKDNIYAFVGVRERHFSNAKIKQPNRGVDINQIVAGISWKF